MAYVPPHKRSLKVQEKELHPDSLSPNFNMQTKLKREIKYTENSIIRCFPVGVMENGEFPCSVILEPYEFVDDEYRKGKKSYALRNIDQPTGHIGTVTCSRVEGWLYVAEKIQSDVLMALKIVRNLIEDDKSSTLKPVFVARIGKVLFHGKNSMSLKKISESFLNEFDPKSGVRRFFHTVVTDAYMNSIENKVVQDIGISLKEKKDRFVLKIEDTSNPDCTLTCKCTIKGDGKLELQKIEANPLRHLVVDLACLFQDHDLRIMLMTKRIVESLTAEERRSIMEIIESAIIDSNVKGGLRWPLGKESAGVRFRVQDAFHIVSKSFVCPVMRVKLRSADRFHLGSSLGELACEVNMKLMGLTKHLKEPGSDEATKEALHEVLKLIWESFMDCKS